MPVTRAQPPEPPVVGVIGGSGLYSLLEGRDIQTVELPTPYGPTSSSIAVGDLAGVRVAFLARHGARHSLPPHRVPYRANLWALARLGVRAVLTSSAVGSLSTGLPPGSFVLPDQLIDRTWGRADTFFDGGDVQHVPFSDPYSPGLRGIAASALAAAGHEVVPAATTVVIQGPRFSTRAESRWYRDLGAHLVNMTQYPEAALAAELNLDVVNLSFVTDVDAGDTEAEAVDPAVVLERMADAGPRLRACIAAIVSAIPADFTPRVRIPEDAVRRVLAAEPGVGADRLPEPGAAR
jgi:5'-methylthioadenosine phosphorylase